MSQLGWSPALRRGAPSHMSGAEVVAAEEPKNKRRKAMEEKKKPGALSKSAPGDAPKGRRQMPRSPELPAAKAARKDAPDTPGAEGSPMPLAVRCCRCDTEVSLKEATKKSRLTHVCHKCSRLGSRLN